jgi:hypothetical protein
VVVVSGLNNPRQLSLAHGVLLVAEAGRGGTLGEVTGLDGGPARLGYTGSVTAVRAPGAARRERPHRVVTGLLSAGAEQARSSSPLTGYPTPAGSFALGPDGVSARSLSRIGIIETTFGLDTPPAAKPFDGQLLLASPRGHMRPGAAITDFDRRHDPDGMGMVSDPYPLLAYGPGWLVADAAGNTVYRVGGDGRISVFHVFANVTTGACASRWDPLPTFPGCNFAPTSLAVDRAGNVYVGGLSSLVPREAHVVELDSRGRARAVWGGLSSVTGVAVGCDGALYVSQMFADESRPARPGVQGVVTRIRGRERVSVDVPFPSGIAVDRHGSVYVSVFSIMPATGSGRASLDDGGQVWRLRL